MLFAQLVDDAGLFPPALLTMGDAVRRHLADHSSGNAAGILSGRFVCPASRLPELATEIAPADGIDVSVIVAPLTAEGVARTLVVAGEYEGIRVVAVEGPITETGPPPGRDTVYVFVELPVLGEWEAGLATTSSAGLGVKIRCGGVTVDAFPTPAQLGRLVRACAGAGVRFKATAGLHHAVRHTDPTTGFTHHGVLNLLLATARAVGNATEDDVVEVLTVTDAAALVTEVRSLSPEAVAHTRQTFVSYGSCSTSEPVEDLRRLGLVGAPV